MRSLLQQRWLNLLLIKSLVIAFILFCSQSGRAQGAALQTSLIRAADSLYQSQQWKAAKEKYLQYLKDSAHQPMYWQRVGYCNHQIGLYKEAIANYEKALALNPVQQLRFTIQARLARSYGQLKNEKAALQWLEKAVQSGYQDINEINRVKDFDAFKESKAFKEMHQRIYDSAYPCSIDPRSKEFNFWIGEWDVYQNGSNILVGHSLVQKVSGECALLENWTATFGTSTGKSLNYYDPVVGHWEQDWIGSKGGPQRFVNGIYKDSAMRFIYESMSDGKKTTGNFIFYNLGADKVRQFQDSSVDGGKTFTVVYDFIYIRKK